MRWLLCLALAWISQAQIPPLNEEFRESLHIKQLNDGKVYTHFAFKTILKHASPRLPETLSQEDQSQHYTLMPLAIGQILREYAVTELHLTLNSGRWNYEKWGYPEDPGVSTGAELWAWMGEGGPDGVDTRWKGLTNALAGLFCASLGELPDRRTTSPLYAFRAEGNIPNTTPHTLRHATLASERICTENLTPFLKLLPCKDYAGLASLLNPHKIFDADWHGMGIHVVWQESIGITLRLTVGAVFDPLRLDGTRNWSFDSIFGRRIPRPCPAALENPIRIRSIAELGRYGIVPGPAHYERSKGNAWDLYTMTPDLNINVTWPSYLDRVPWYHTHYGLTETEVHVRRSLTGAGQAHGGLEVLIRNSFNDTQRVVYVETMPWFIKFYLHTLHASIDGQQRSDVIQSISYIPPIDHAHPTLLEIPVILPPLASVKLNIEFEKAFLGYTQHPPDASRGWDLPGAVIVALPLNASALKKEPGPRMYTHPLLADLATPDFSMPYNVIIMTSTLVALLFGSVFNLLTRKFIVLELKP